MIDILIIGAGIIGSLIARELAKYQLNILVLEKNNDVCNETTMANSGIIHSGYDPIPHTLKSKLNAKGNAMFDKLVEELDVSFERFGSITVAFSREELEILKELQQRATINGVDTFILSKEELLKKEPLLNANVVGGLLAPSAGIIDPFNLCVHAMENAIDNGVDLHLNEAVTSIKKEGDFFLVNNQYKVKMVINCSGVYGDTINEMINPKTFSILPRKGEYYVLNHFKAPFVKHTLFMVPTDKGKGVLITPTTSGNYLIGPSVELGLRDDKSTDKETLFSIKNKALLMIDKIPFNETIRTFAGVRATPTNRDFIIEESSTKNFINVVGIESPGLASSPAIADMVVNEIISNRIALIEKPNYNPKVKKYHQLKDLSIAEKQLLFQENKDYGTIVCKCEQVTKGEIIDCLQRSCPPHSVKALKKRLRVGFGKCQGGMCQSEAIKIMAEYYHIDEKNIPYDGLNSYILLSNTKEVD